MGKKRNKKQILCDIIDAAQRQDKQYEGRGGSETGITMNANLGGTFGKFYFSVASRGNLLQEIKNDNGNKRYKPSERGKSYKKAVEESEKMFEPFSDIEKMLREQP